MSDDIIKNLRPTYAQINLHRIRDNIGIARRLSNSDIIAIVKADGYGHGAKEVADYAYEYCGVNNFGVATLFEGLSLRECFDNSNTRIIILGYVDKMFYDEVVGRNLTLTIFDEQIAHTYNDYLTKKDLYAKIALKIDTGMGRLGFSTDMNFEHFTLKYPRLIINHVMSHFSSSDEDFDYSEMQEEKFKKMLISNSDMKFDTSMYNSSAIVNFNNNYSLTRPGLLLYGYVLGGKAEGIKPAMSIHSKIVHVQSVKKRQSVSYNRKFIATKDTKVGVVPIGYADGYSRSLSNRGGMYVGDVYCPVIGNICMDMTMLDISELGDNAYGAPVEIMGDRITATKIAASLNTVEYEVLCSISDRIPRIYSLEE